MSGPDLFAYGDTADARKIDNIRQQALETGRNRLLVTGALIAMAFVIISGRLIELTMLQEGHEPRLAQSSSIPASRGDILDRNGIILATSLPTVSLFADPKLMFDAQENARHVVDQLFAVLPELDPQTVYEKLRSKNRFVWLYRNLTPEQQHQVNRLGIPGLGFKQSERRVYPHGEIAAHILGLTDIDGQGVAGVERYFDRRLQSGTGPLRLSIDLRIQDILGRELASAMEEFQGIGAAGVVMDVNTGEVIAMVSLPDYDPNTSGSSRGEAGFNRVTKGVYEMGSTFKLFTAAMALDTGTVNMDSGYDAATPIKISRFTINDYHAQNRWLTVPEIILHSSNIGAAKMARDVGSKTQQDYLGRLGLLEAPKLEVPEIGKPLVPKKWREINTMTISYGHGIAVSPLQLVSGVSTLVNGGTRFDSTLIKQTASAMAGTRVISEETSLDVRKLMRLVVSNGTGRNAAAKGYLVGGKTGTAEKLRGKSYDRKAKISSFVGAFPMNSPRYVVFALIDEPKGIKRTQFYATGGWVAAPIVGRVINQVGLMLGIAPDYETEMVLPEIIQAKANKKKKPNTPRSVSTPGKVNPQIPKRRNNNNENDDEDDLLRRTRKVLNLVTLDKDTKLIEQRTRL